MKILFLVNGKIKADNTCEGTPVMMRTIRNSPTPIPVFDIATYYTFTQFNAAERPKHFAWTFTSQDGKIDDAMQLFPFDPTTNNSDPSFDTNHKYWKKKVDTTITNHVVTVAHWYNAFREGAEWAGARADDDTTEIQLIADLH